MVNNEPQEAKWNYRESVDAFAELHGFFDQQKISSEGRTYKGRRVIYQDSPINDGVFVTSHEAIVVDDKKDTLIVQEYQNLLANLQEFDTFSKGEAAILRAVANFTRSVLIPDESINSEVDMVLAQQAAKEGKDNAQGKKITIDWFIKQRRGTCRHQALLSGYFLERLVKEGHLQGKVSIDSNFIGNNGHSWVRFETSKGLVYVVDVMRGLVEPLSKAERNEQNPDKWSYQRPEDKSPLKKLLLPVLRKVGIRIY